MAKVLLVGYDPETVDFSDPALPPGMNVEKIRAGIALALKLMTERGWEAGVCFVNPDETATKAVEAALASAVYDCVVVGAGVRLPPKSLHLFEAVINTIHRAAPSAAIAFNTVPQDSADAAARWIASVQP
jgi:cytosine/adenosine deaminase-related metal-dependent hydrolase